MASTSAGLTACGLQRAPSPISRGTTWIITQALGNILRRSCGCSGSCSALASLPSSMPTARLRPRSERSARRAASASFRPALKATICVCSTQSQEFSIRLTVAHGGKAYVALLPLAGSFQASNALVAAGLCIATGSPPGAVFAALEQLKGAPGRLELAGRRCGAPVFIDYAHKPDALEHALKAVRPFVQGKLIVVFGCGGDRDAGKRPLMGEAAARLADHVIITDDNPRSEDPGLIRKAILAGVSDLRKAGEVAGRAEAIARAIAMLGPRDGLVIAGKGHESGQIIGDTTLPFSDKDCVRAVLKDLSS